MCSSPSNLALAIPFTFREMTASGIEPNTETFEFLILALIRLKRYEDAEIAYQSMRERKVESSRDILFHMMKMYLILKDETRALEMVSLIKERQFGIDTPMINALLTYYYTTKQPVGIENTVAMMKTENVQPNQITLNLLMLFHNQQNNTEELQRVYQQFEQLGFYPDDVTLNVLSEARAKTGDGTYHAAPLSILVLTCSCSQGYLRDHRQVAGHEQEDESARVRRIDQALFEHRSKVQGRWIALRSVRAQI